MQMFAHVQQAEQKCDAALDTAFAKPPGFLGVFFPPKTAQFLCESRKVSAHGI